MIRFGSYTELCQSVQLQACQLLGDDSLGLTPICYARNVDVGGVLIFQTATLVIDILAVVMTLIMIWHIRSKYTAVGRREMVMFFYLYLAATIFDGLTISGIVPLSSGVYQYFVAATLGLYSAMTWCLLLNGFVGFQWAEDGTALSLWTFRLTSLLVFGLQMFVALATFNNLLFFRRSAPLGLFITSFVINGLFLAVYVISQVILVVNTLDEYWPLGNICFAVIFYFLGLSMTVFLSVSICEGIKHYVDGVFFGTICTLLAVMMIYKYWDSITKEDLEFSVGGKGNVWEVKELLNEDDEFAPYLNQPDSIGYANQYPNQYPGQAAGQHNVSFANTAHQSSYLNRQQGPPGY